MINLLELINSNDISDYLRKINYKFNTQEALWIVNNNFYLNFKKKEELLYEVMKEYKDTSFKGYDSLYDLVKINLQRKNEAKDFFTNVKDSYIYTFAVCYTNCDDYKSDVYFSSYDSVINYIDTNRNEFIGTKESPIKENYKNDEVIAEFAYVTVYKYKLDSENYIGEVFLNDKLEITDLNVSRDALDYSVGNDLPENISADVTGEMYLKFPTPFKKGDILVHKLRKGIRYDSGPFVLCEKVDDFNIQDEDCCDSFDMIFTGYFLNDDGSIFYEHIGNCMGIEYYHDELDGVKRSLIAVSNFLKGNISVERLLDGIDQIRLENKSKEHYDRLFMTEEGLKLCGLKK